MSETPVDNPSGNEPERPPQDGQQDAPPAVDAPAKKTARKAAAKKAPAKKAAARKTAKKAAAAPVEGADAPVGASAGTPVDTPVDTPADAAAEGEQPRPRKKAAKRPAKKAAAPADQPSDEREDRSGDEASATAAPAVLFQAPEKPKKATKKAAAKKTAKKATKKAAAAPEGEETDAAAQPAPAEAPEQADGEGSEGAEQAPAAKKAQRGPKPQRAKKAAAGEAAEDEKGDRGDVEQGEAADTGEADADEGGEGAARRRPRRRGGRRRRKSGGDGEAETDESTESGAESSEGGDEGAGETAGSRRRRTRNRAPKSPEDEIASVSGSTRLEAKKQRRREGREAGRRRAPIVSEAEFLARRESVERVMVVRQRDDLTQIGVLEDKVLVEHYVSRESQTSLIGNVYLGRVQNVLPSMEAAFVDIGKGRNAVLYAGEVNWAGLGHQEGQPRKIESVLSPGQPVLVQVTKDPIGHKGARLTGQVSLPGRFLVYVPDGTTSGISRKLPDTERNRLKTLLKEIVPDTAGVIVRTAAEGASEDELTRDVERLTARWADIEAKVKAGKAPQLLYGEPDLTLKVVRDLFTEDFSRLIVQGDEAWDLVDGYVSHVAPDLRERLERYEPGESGGDLFATYRVDEQIAKGLDRKVWLPSGGSLIIDRTEAMTVVDVNTGKFTGSGGNLEETVTKNNLEAAEEIVRQLRLRDIGGIIVVDFIDMVLESNRDLVLRRLVECLGRDRTRHQVAEVTSLGLVQMTRKRIGTGLLEAFSEECTACKGRGLIVHEHPVETAGSSATEDEPRGRRGRGRGRGRGNGEQAPKPVPSPKDLAATRPHPPTDEDGDAAENGEHGVTGVDDGSSDAAPESTEAGVLADAPEVEPSAVEEVASATVEESTDDTEEAGDTEDTADTAGTAGSGSDAAGEGAEAAPSSVVEPTPPEPAEPQAPKVVTRRRRTASRPAGPPAGAPAADGDQDGQPAASSDQPALPGVTAEDALPADAEEPVVVHVPIKKKGARKR